jgi:hypothetical protein
MSSSKQGRLNVWTADGATEIWVIDTQQPNAAPAGHGLGSLSVDLLPGIYRVRATAGLQIWEQLVELSSGGVENVSVPLLDFASPIPLPDTAQTHPYHTEAAIRESHRVRVNAGHGSAIFVFAGRWSTPSAPPADYASQVPVPDSAESSPETATEAEPLPHPALGLSLRSLAGEPVADLKGRSVVETDPARDAWAACNVQVDPGIYRLRLSLPGRDNLEQVIVAAPGWQTEVFLQQRLYRSAAGAESERADLAGASILYSRFNPDDPAQSLAFAPEDPEFGPSLRLLELARLGLSSGRNVLSRDITEMMWAKWQNPMLGILGAHLLLLSPEPDLALLRTVVENLRYGIWPGFPHPDVEALALASSAQASGYVFAEPPMLRLSWSLVIGASNSDPSLVPEGSLAFDVATRVWGNSPWLLWRNPPPGKRAAKPVDEYAESFAIQMDALEKPVSKGGGSRSIFSFTERDDQSNLRSLSKGLNLPRSNVEALYRKTRKE